MSDIENNAQEARRLAEEVVRRDDTKLTEALLADAIGHLADAVDELNRRVDSHSKGMTPSEHSKQSGGRQQLGGHEDALDSIAAELQFQADQLRRLGFVGWHGDLDALVREINTALGDWDG